MGMRMSPSVHAVLWASKVRAWSSKSSVPELLHPHPLRVRPVHLLALVSMGATVLCLNHVRGEQQEQQGQEKANAERGRQGEGRRYGEVRGEWGWARIPAG